MVTAQSQRQGAQGYPDAIPHVRCLPREARLPRWLVLLPKACVPCHVDGHGESFRGPRATFSAGAEVALPISRYISAPGDNLDPLMWALTLRTISHRDGPLLPASSLLALEER